jgi:hypothetical protein
VFLIAADQPADEDAIVGWITDDDASSRSVMGATGIFERDAAPAMAASEGEARDFNGDRPGSESAPAYRPEPYVRLRHIDASGAHFKFLASSLRKEDLRSAFPRKCVGCGTRSDLSVHAIHWAEKTAGHEPTPHRDRLDTPVGRLDAFTVAPDRSLLSQLSRIRHAPEPLNLPLPVFCCPDCRPSAELRAYVEHRGGGQVCYLTISSLAIAVDFFRAAGGRNTPEYRRLIEARDLRRDAWRELDGQIRHRIAAWLNLQEGEHFVGFYPDVELSTAETGSSGVVLTTQRLLLKKYAVCRAYGLDADVRVEFITKDEQSRVHVHESGHAPVVLKLARGTAGNLAGALRKLHGRLVVTG